MSKKTGGLSKSEATTLGFLLGIFVPLLLFGVLVLSIMLKSCRG